jgi:hypothetical protein
MKTGQRSETHTIFSSGEECKSAPRTYDIMTHIPGAGTATTGRRHNHSRRRHSHRRLHCRLWHRNHSPMSDARTSASRHVSPPHEFMTSPGAGTATTGRRHNHPRRRHSHRRLHCRLWCRNNSPTSDARTSVSQNITINIHTTIPHGTDTATAGDILTYPRCRTTAGTATGDYTSNTPVIHTSTTTHTLPSRHRYPPVPSITGTATTGDIHSFTHHRPIAGTATGDYNNMPQHVHQPRPPLPYYPSGRIHPQPILHR